MFDLPDASCREVQPTVEEAELAARINWLIRLRWIAVFGVLAMVWVAVHFLHLALPSIPLLLVVLVMVFYNACFSLYAKSAAFKVSLHAPARSATFAACRQISLDMLCLTALLSLSGGIENPFIFYFIFHMIIASILLSKRASYIQATVAVVLFGLMVGLEYCGVIPHFCLLAHSRACLHGNRLYLAGVSGVFVSTIYLSVHMATSISSRLREKGGLLHGANEELKRQDRLKSEYVLRVSHDIKADLSAIQSCLKVALEEAPDAFNERQCDMIARAERRTQNVLHFVKDLLDLSRMRTGQAVRMAPVWLREIVDIAASEVHGRLQKKGIAFDVDLPPDLPMVQGNKGNLEHLFVNLLTNAVKYTPEMGNIQVQATDCGAHVLVRVVDTGIGIPAADLPRVFDEFFRASNAQEAEKDGTGLGLAIVKQIVQQHGGRIWAESMEGLGTCFMFTLPRNSP